MAMRHISSAREPCDASRAWPYETGCNCAIRRNTTALPVSSLARFGAVALRALGLTFEVGESGVCQSAAGCCHARTTLEVCVATIGNTVSSRLRHPRCRHRRIAKWPGDPHVALQLSYLVASR